MDESYRVVKARGSTHASRGRGVDLLRNEDEMRVLGGGSGVGLNPVTSWTPPPVPHRRLSAYARCRGSG